MGLLGLVHGTILTILSFVPLGTILVLTDWTVVHSDPPLQRLATPADCPTCQYELTGLGDDGTCPECGAHFHPLPVHPNQSRLVATPNMSRLPGLIVSIVVPAVLLPMSVPLALAIQYFRAEPWAAAWHNAAHRPWTWQVFMGLALCLIPMGLVASILRKWQPPWAFPITIGGGMLGGLLWFFSASGEHLALLLAWQTKVDPESGLVVYSCLGVIAASAVGLIANARKAAVRHDPDSAARVSPLTPLPADPDPHPPRGTPHL